MIELSGIKAIVTDIEGTTSSLSFVHDVLFPYARTHLADYARAHQGEIWAILDEVRGIENNPALTIEDIIGILIRWSDEDRKATPLKTLQGLIWEAGFKSGAFKGHVYDDAAQALRIWFDSGMRLYVYSSGSIAAQKLLYSHSVHGDLTLLFCGYFDTTTGPKREKQSYVKIADSVGLPPAEIVFLSDMPQELDAAEEAGFQTVLLDRQNEHSENLPYNKVSDFQAIKLREKAA